MQTNRKQNEPHEADNIYLSNMIVFQHHHNQHVNQHRNNYSKLLQTQNGR